MIRVFSHSKLFFPFPQPALPLSNYSAVGSWGGTLPPTSFGNSLPPQQSSPLPRSSLPTSPQPPPNPPPTSSGGSPKLRSPKLLGSKAAYPTKPPPNLPSSQPPLPVGNSLAAKLPTHLRSPEVRSPKLLGSKAAYPTKPKAKPNSVGKVGDG